MIRNWILHFFGNTSGSIKVGSRVHHRQYGRGTVMGGSLHIKYDKTLSRFKHQPNHKTYTTNISSGAINIID